MSVFNDFGNRWCKPEGVEDEALKAWKRSIFTFVDKRLKFHSQTTNLLPPKPKSSFRHLKQGIQEFKRKYVLVSADKAANNVVCVVYLGACACIFTINQCPIHHLFKFMKLKSR